MPDNTTNYGLVKPYSTEKVDISVINGNMDIIDEVLHDLETADVQAEADLSSLTSRTVLLETAASDLTSRTAQLETSAESLGAQSALAEQTLGGSVKNLIELADFDETKTGFKYPKMRPLKPGKYILSYKVNTIANNPQEWRWKNAEGTVIKSVLTRNNVPEISVEVDLTETAETMDVYFNTGGSYSEFMLRDARITDAAFEAYKPSFEERIAALEAALAAQGTAPETVQEEVTGQ